MDTDVCIVVRVVFAAEAVLTNPTTQEQAPYILTLTTDLCPLSTVSSSKASLNICPIVSSVQSLVSLAQREAKRDQYPIAPDAD